MQMKKELLACIAVLFIVTTAASFQPPRVPTNKVKDFPGQTVNVCGKVETCDCDEKKDRTTVLHLDAPYWSNEVGILIPGTARDQFGPGLEGRSSGNIRPILATTGSRAFA
jgi:hypothetical protein